MKECRDFSVSQPGRWGLPGAPLLLSDPLTSAWPTAELLDGPHHRSEAVRYVWGYSDPRWPSESEYCNWALNSISNLQRDLFSLVGWVW